MPCCKGVRAVVNDWSNWASDDGFHHTANAKRTWLKVTWIVLYLLCWGVFFYQLYGCLMKYLSYPYNVGTALYYEGLPFPAITVCNLNPVKFSAFATNAMTNASNDPFMQLEGTFFTALGMGPAPNNTYTKFSNVTAWSPSAKMREPVSTTPGNPAPYAPVCANQVCKINGVAYPPPSTNYPADSELLAGKILNTTLSTEFDKWYLADQYARILMDREQPAINNGTFGYTADDMFISCTYNGFSCTALSWSNGSKAEYTPYIQRYSPIYGNCYTFNEEGSQNSTRSGPLYGLQLLVRVNQDDYMGFTRTAGVRVTIHLPGQEPFIDTFGYDAPPGMVSSFGLSYAKFNRLGGHYDNCQTTVTNNPAASLSDPTAPNMTYLYSGVYQQEGCFRTCLQTIVAVSPTACTYDPRMGIPNPILPNDKSCASRKSGIQSDCYDGCDELFFGCTPETVSGNQLWSDCVNDDYTTLENLMENTNVYADCVGDAIGFTDKTKGCPILCNEKSFSVTVSTAMWPSLVYQSPDCNNVTNINRYYKNIDNCIDWYRSNTLFIEAYFEAMYYKEQNASATYDSTAMINDVVGQLGLFIGWSVLTAVEVLCLLAMIFKYLCKCNKSTIVLPEEEHEPDSVSDNSADEDPNGTYKKGDMPADATKNNLYKPQTPGADIEPPRIAE